MTLNGVMADTLRYFPEVGKPALQKTICGGIYARVYYIFSACTMSSQRKFTFAISSPDEFLVYYSGLVAGVWLYIQWQQVWHWYDPLTISALCSAESTTLLSDILPLSVLAESKILLSVDLCRKIK